MSKFRLLTPAIAALIFSHTAIDSTKTPTDSFQLAGFSQAEMDAARMSTFRTVPSSSDSNGW